MIGAYSPEWLTVTVGGLALVGVGCWRAGRVVLAPAEAPLDAPSNFGDWSAGFRDWSEADADTYFDFPSSQRSGVEPLGLHVVAANASGSAARGPGQSPGRTLAPSSSRDPGPRRARVAEVDRSWLGIGQSPVVEPDRSSPAAVRHDASLFPCSPEA